MTSWGPASLGEGVPLLPVRGARPGAAVGVCRVSCGPRHGAVGRHLRVPFVDERKTFPRHLAVGAGGLGWRKGDGAPFFFFFPLVSVLSRTLSGPVWVREVESPPLLYLLTDGGVRPAVKGGAWCVSHRRTGACGVHRVVVALLLCKKDVTLPERAVYLFIFSVKCRVVCGQAPAGPGPPRCQGSGQGPTLSGGTGACGSGRRRPSASGPGFALSVGACRSSPGRPLLWSAAPSVGVIFI